MLQTFINIIIKKFKKKSDLNNNSLSSIGICGEDLAAKYLRKEKGYKLLARNWRHKGDEIDIIAQDGEVLVFLEVKASVNEALVPVYYRVTTTKKKNLERVCKAYLRRANPRPKHFRFDIVTVKLCQDGENCIKHYTNVRLFSKNFHTLRDE